MRGYVSLTDQYVKIMDVDLQKDRKNALIVNGIALIIAVVMAVAGGIMVPIGFLFDMEQGLGAYALRFLVLCAGCFVYIILHEMVHGVIMLACSGVKPFFGFTGLYAYAGSKCYFDKSSYIVIALAPIVVWGAVLGGLCTAADTSWFWVWYILQIINVSGAAGDLYVSALFSKLPRDILVQDTGVSMCVYSRSGKNK